jgi:hypothetical protein
MNMAHLDPMPEAALLARARAAGLELRAQGGRLAALRRPVNWADPVARPCVGCFCSCCKGQRWWGDARGWRCWQCHPPDGARTGSIMDVQT